MISKCKVCGGNINAKEDAKYVICEYCSTTYETDNGKIDINVSCNVNNTAKKKSLLPLLICLFLLVFVIVGGLIVMSLMKINTSLEKPEDNDVSYVSEIYEKNSELQRNENKNTIEEKNNKPEFVYIENVEEQVKLIRKKYYSTQNDLGALNVTQIGKYKIYKNSDGDIKKVDFALNSNAYDVCYYYENGELYFVFAFDGKKENRFYIYKNQIIRWINEAGTVFDNEYNNPELQKWQKIIFDEAKLLKENI